MGGRGLRPEGGTCLILDHGGVVAEHGFLDEPIEWTLDGKEKAWKVPKKKPTEPKLVKCTFCAHVFSGGNVCPECGSPVKSFGKPVEAVDAELVEASKEKATIAEKRRYLGMLKYWQRTTGKNPKIVNAKYRSRFKCWPAHQVADAAPIPPDMAFYNRLKYDAIRWAKSKKVDK
jgi:hypothetical protein